eukprot:Sspe_Gene.79273::Locus_49688_Transcript_3_3_Confidence_0.556_Length_491::g.79273::m.79273
MYTSTGTAAYMAPETLHKGAVSVASDIFGLGVVLLVLATLPDFPMLENEGELMLLNSPGWKEDTLERSLRKALAAYSEVLQDTCVNMLRHDPSARPSADDIEAMANLMVDGLRSKGFSPEAVVHYE